ncbi:MAG: NhaA family Na+:H+ antiporter, partial [bacterium]
WVNDGVMYLFFFTIGLEVKRALFDEKGSLNSLQKAALPAIAAVAGVVVPAAIYVAFNHGDVAALKGWAVPTATDIAFALGVLMLVGVKRVPLSVKVFLLAIAVLDDLIAVGVIAIFYSHELNMDALMYGSIFIGLLAFQNYKKSNNFMFYLLWGAGLWGCTLASGIHPTVAGVITALMIPTTAKLGGSYSLLKTWEHELSPMNAWIVMPLFALANAGVNLAGVTMDTLLNPVTGGVAIALAFGKPVGIIGATLLAIKYTSLKLPDDMTKQHLTGIGLLAAIGFTMSIFVTDLAFHNNAIFALDSKMAVLIASFLMGTIGFIYCRFNFPVLKDGAVKNETIDIENDSNEKNVMPEKTCNCNSA